MKKIALLLVFALVVQLMPVNSGIVWAADETSGTTLPDSTVITEEIIPDETLLNCIKDCIGKSSEETITYGDIKNISTLSYAVEKTKELGWKPIETLEGIGVLTSLSSLKITGHNITDLTPLAETENLYSLWAEDNKISVMPDFSDKSMSAFYIDRNRMSYETMYNNMPSNWKQYAKDNSKRQVAETVDTIASDKYYEVKDRDGNSYYPFVMNSTNVRTSREYSLKTVTVDGIDMTDKFKIGTNSRTATPEDFSYDCTYVYVMATDGDFLEKSVEHTIKAVVTDEYDETFTLETTCIMEPYQDTYEIKVEDTEYLSTTGVMKTGIKLADKQFLTKESSVTVSKVEFADQDGNIYGAITNGQSYTPYYAVDCRYSNREIRDSCERNLSGLVPNYTNLCCTAFTTYSNIYVRQELEEGFYDLIYTLTDGTKYIFKNAYEAVTRPIIYGVYDTDNTVETSNAVITDQTGDYVSIYVYGWNISKDTVKPVFYNENEEAITGDVAAVETDKWGGYFRIDKENPDSDDWNISMYASDDQQEGSKEFDVKLETEEETFEESVYINRRDIFYQNFDNRDNSFTVYFANKADLDTKYNMTLSFVKYEYDENIGMYGYVPIMSIADGTLTEEINELTGQKETKVKFTLTDEQVTTIQADDYDLYYQVEYKDKAGYVKSHRSDYLAKNAQGGYDFDDVPEKGIFSGYYTHMFYLPYWIGGVHLIAPNNEEYYYLTKDDVAVLSEGKYAYADIYDENASLDETNFEQRSYNYYFMTEGEPPAKPVGKPVLSVEKQGDIWRLNWTEVSGANKYYVYLKYNDVEIPVWQCNNNYLEEEAEIMTILFSEYFEECRLNADESKMEIFVRPINVVDGAQAYGDNSNVLTIAGIKSNVSSGSNNHTHTMKTQITKAQYGKNGVEKIACTNCNDMTKTTTIYAPKSVTVTELVYNGKNQTPKVVVKDSQGKVIDKSNYMVSTVKNVGVNTVTITFNASSKYYTGKMTATVKVNPKGTTLAKLTSKKKSIVVKWKKQTTKTKGYQIQYSTNKNFKKDIKTVTVKKNKKTSYTIKKLKSKKKYYVRIRTYNGKCYSVWSKKKSIKTK